MRFDVFFMFFFIRNVAPKNNTFSDMSDEQIAEMMDSVESDNESVDDDSDDDVNEPDYEPDEIQLQVQNVINNAIENMRHAMHF